MMCITSTLTSFESVASRASHVTLQTVRVWGSLELDTLLNILLVLHTQCQYMNTNDIISITIYQYLHG